MTEISNKTAQAAENTAKYSINISSSITPRLAGAAVKIMGIPTIGRPSFFSPLATTKIITDALPAVTVGCHN